MIDCNHSQRKIQVLFAGGQESQGVACCPGGGAASCTLPAAATSPGAVSVQPLQRSPQL